MSKSVVPDFNAFTTSSRSVMITTSATDGSATEIRSIGPRVLMGIERPTAMSRGWTVSPTVTAWPYAGTVKARTATPTRSRLIPLLIAAFPD
jgi:hypothetical protein